MDAALTLMVNFSSHAIVVHTAVLVRVMRAKTLAGQRVAAYLPDAYGDRLAF